ncbi:MAG: SH3 domain-containing protein [Bacilli bacterium]|nr:SH3 domain-containing protein [Bacilli bacterium]
MKKILLILLISIASFFSASFYVSAATVKAKVPYSDVYIRKGPGTNYDYVRKAAVNATFDMVSNQKVATERGCADGWYKVYYSGESVGYICSSYVTLITIEEVHDTPTTECEKELANAGFPKTYWPELCALKSQYPNWSFEADVNGLDFAVAVSKEAVGKKSLIQTSYQGYLSTTTDSYDYLTDTFVVKEGKNWYSASPDVVAYYLDPRNFLDERYIFMFEKLSFDEEYQTVEAVQTVLNGRDLAPYSETIYTASRDNNINAIYLASRIRQETGANYSSYSLAGNAVTYNGITYDHVYNPYNIGANTGAHDGLVWAVAGTTYLRPWDNIPNAITGGAQVISVTYIAKGQDTGYFQKYNTSSYSEYSTYSHQYMTNVKAAYSEASIAYDGYQDMDLLKSTAFTFVIPVYSNMSDQKYSLPEKGNPNNHLNKLTINGKDIKGFAHDNYEYTHYVSSGAQEVRVEATAINSKATISGTGNIKLLETENKIEVIVTAENKSVQKYTIKVVRTDGIEMSVKDIVDNMNVPLSENHMLLTAGNTVENITSLAQKTAATAKVSVTNKASGNLSTGDVVTITNGGDTVTYNIVIKGDPTGDGNINIQDLLRVQKFILGYTDLNGSYLKAGDTNQDGIVDIVDLLRIQKHILGYLTIS